MGNISDYFYIKSNWNNCRFVLMKPLILALGVGLMGLSGCESIAPKSMTNPEIIAEVKVCTDAGLDWEPLYIVTHAIYKIQCTKRKP